MHLTGRVWIQLAVLLVVTFTSCGAMLINYMKAPATIFGIGRYTVTVNLTNSGGLYESSLVTYRGTPVGQVTQIRATTTGAQAVLSMESKVSVPADVEAQVHSRSAVGEQYIDLVPRSANGGTLRNGDVIAVEHSTIPADVAKLLDDTTRALHAIPKDNLTTVVDESYTAVGGLGPEMARIVDGSTSLANEAGRTLGPIQALIDDSGPVLDSQTSTKNAIAVWADRMAAITSQLRAQDTAVNDLLRQSAPALDEGTGLLNRIAPTLPVLLANVVSLGEIAVTYRPDLEQLLVLLPQGVAQASANLVPDMNNRKFRGIYLDLAMNINLPPPCTTGYLPATQRRPPSEVDYPDVPPGMTYCRVPQDSELDVRGIRNTPCRTVPGKRAPTAEECESDRQYVPLNDGYNWKGDPNATLSGQDVPELPVSAASPPPLAVATYDPSSGSYVGPDGQRYTQSDLASPVGPKTWQSLLVPPDTLSSGP